MKSENEISQILDITRPIIINGNSISEKTNLLIKKILYLIENNLFEKDSILTLTFSKTSAKSIAESIENNLENYSNIFSCLDFAKKLYCDYFNLIPEVDKSYKILNSQYSNYFFQKNIKEFELSSIKLKNNFVLVAKELYETIFKLRNKAIKLNDLEKLEVKNINQKIDIFSTYAKYEQYKKRNNFIDEQDIFFHLTSLLKRDKIIREEIQKKYSYILVNEFHYLTKLELDFLSLIINKDNITIFNDSNLCSTLNQNDSILFIDSLENSKIINLNKKLDTSLDILKLNCISSKSEKSQLNFIFEKIEIIKHKNESLGIFFKDIFQLELVSNNLNRLNIFHSKNLPLNFRTNQMIKEILCILEIIINPKEANLSLFFLLSQLPIRKETLKLISRKASLNEKSLFLVLENNAEISEYKNENEIILTFFNKIKLLIRLYESKLSYKKLVYKIISLFDFYSIADLNNNVENIYALNSFIQDFENYVSIFHNSSIEDYLEFSKLSQNININNFNSYQADSKVQLHLINNNIYEDYDNIIIPYFDKEIFSANTNKSNFEIFDNNINNNINFNKNILNYEKIFFDKIISKSRFSISFLSLEKNYKESKLLISNLINKTNYEINEINYLNKANLYNIEIKEKERLESIKKIQDLLFQNNFNEAINEINTLKNNFKIKSLTNYLNSNNMEDNSKYFSSTHNINNNFEDIKINPEKMIYSVSQLKTYENCPKKYLFQYIYKIPTLPKHYFDFGTSIHTVLELILPEFDKNISKEILFKKAIKLLHSNWISKAYVDSKQEKEYFKKGIDSIKDFIEKEFELRLKKRKIIALEKKFLIEINGKKITGFIDRIDKCENDFEILDYKTSNSIESQSQLKENLQLYVYAVALKKMEEFKVLPKKVGLWYLIHDKIISLDIDVENLDKVKEKIYKIITDIENNNFKPNPSKFNCTYCDFNLFCSSSLF